MRPLRIAIVTLLLLLTCCAPAAPRRYEFVGVVNNFCDEDLQRSHWDAKRRAFVIVCKPSTVAQK